MGLLRRAASRALVVLGAALAACALGSVPSAQAGTSRRCAEARGKTLMADAVTRVYRRTGGGTYACALPGGRSLGLGDQGSWPDIARVRPVGVAGRFVAYVLSVTNRTGMVVGLHVVDAKRRQAVRTLPVDDEQLGDVGSLAVTATGAVAWIVTRADGVRRVWVAEATAAPRAVAEGAGIDTMSLALGQGRVFWMQDGVAQTATL